MSYKSREKKRRYESANGARLDRTRAPSKGILTRQRKARKAGPVSVKFICPTCGGPHPRKECES